MWRSMASISPMASSATATALRPGTLQTYTPRSAARRQSMVLVPAPARTISPSSVPASMAAAVTSVLRTTRMSNPATWSGSSAAVISGRTTHSSPPARSRSTAASSRLSANRIRISPSYGRPRF